MLFRSVAFDICAANIVLNELAAELGLKMDRGGELARNGRLISALLEELNADAYYEKSEKKSLGREWVEENVIKKIRGHQGSLHDKLRTMAEHIAFQISRVVKENQLNRILITGGGAYNDFLMERIRLLSGKEIVLPKNEIIEFKEALIFAFLGANRILKRNNSLSSVTGAIADKIGRAHV